MMRFSRGPLGRAVFVPPTDEEREQQRRERLERMLAFLAEWDLLHNTHQPTARRKTWRKTPPRGGAFTRRRPGV